MASEPVESRNKSNEDEQTTQQYNQDIINQLIELEIGYFQLHFVIN